MTMATIDHRNHVNMNPKSPDRKLPVQPMDISMMMVTPDRTIATTGTLSPEAHLSGLGHEVDGMISVVKDYVQASKGYSPTRREFERTMEAIEARAAEEEAAEARRLEAERPVQEVGFMDTLYSTFSFTGGGSVASVQQSVASQRGTVVHQMLKRLVLQELQARRDKSATTIQSAARRVLAKRRKQEMRVIAAERKRAEAELASKNKYEQFSRKAAACNDQGNAAAFPEEEEEEVAEEIQTSKYSKMKRALQRLKMKTKKSASKAPLLASIPESSPHVGGDHDLPIQENSSRNNKFWSKVKKMKVKKPFSKPNKRRGRAAKSPVLDGVMEEEPAAAAAAAVVYKPREPRRIAVTITTTDDSIPTPEAEAEALEYQQRRKWKNQQQETLKNQESLNQQKEVVLAEAESLASASQSHASLNSSLSSNKDHFNWNNFVLADDATSISSARSRPLLDSWFKDFIFDKETLKELDDDAIEEMVQLAVTSKELQKDLKIIPEINWTEDDWVDTKDSLFRCSQDHIEEVTYQTRRFASNEVTL